MFNFGPYGGGCLLGNPIYMKPTIALAGLLAVAGCLPEDDGTQECLENNLDDVSDIVEAADNWECNFRYDLEGFDVTCPASEIHTLRIDHYFVVFNDENNDFDFDRSRMRLTCGYHDYEIHDADELEWIQERLRMRFSHLPIPD